MPENTQTAKPHRVPQVLAALTFSRLMMNGMRRFPYLVLTPMAAALGVPRSALEQILSAQWLMALFTPVAAPLIDSGRKRILLITVGLLTAGTALAALGQSFGVVALALLVGSAAKMLFDPTMQAYVGDVIPFARRGMALGVTELAWSGSLITFGPLSAYLITNVGLSAIFAVLSVLSGAAFLVLWVVLPTDISHHVRHIEKVSMRQGLRLLLRNAPALTMLISIGLVALAFDLFLIVYESWLRDAFGLSTLVIGSLSFVFSLAELSGEAVIIFASDRFGKRRIAILSAALTAAAYFLLQFTSGSIPMAMVTLFCMFACFEVSTISLTPLATEALPGARGVMMTLFWTFIAIGRAIGSFSGGWLFRTYGFNANMIVAAVTAGAAALLMVLFLGRETPRKHSSPS